MTAPPVIPFRWDGEHMVPLSRFAKECDKHFVVGQVYPLEAVESRSAKSHAHYFACIGEAWKSLPEQWAEHLNTPEKLRKHALIKGGFCDKRTFVASSKAEAQRIAAFIRPQDDYGIIAVEGCVVTEYTAHSQSMRAMDKKEFQRSKDEVLRVIAEMIGVTTEALKQNAGQAA